MREGSEGTSAEAEIGPGLACQSGRLATQIGAKCREILRAGGDRAEQVAREGGGQDLVAAAESLLVGGNAAVERLGHGLDPPSHPEIAHPQLAQALVHVGKHHVEEPLGERLGAGTLPAQALQEEEDVECHQVEAAVEGVRHAEASIENRQARLGDGVAIEGRGRIATLAPFLQIDQWHGA